MTFDNLLGYILSTVMCMQNFIKIYLTALKMQNFLILDFWWNRDIVLLHLIIVYLHVHEL